MIRMPPAVRKRMVRARIAQWLGKRRMATPIVKVQGGERWRGSVDLKQSLFCEVRDRVEVAFARVLRVGASIVCCPHSTLDADVADG